MKLIELFKKLHSAEIIKGEAYLKSEYKLTILKGKLNKKGIYYYTFNPSFAELSDVTLTLGTGEKQYLVKII